MIHILLTGEHKNSYTVYPIQTHVVVEWFKGFPKYIPQNIPGLNGIYTVYIRTCRHKNGEL